MTGSTGSDGLRLDRLEESGDESESANPLVAGSGKPIPAAAIILSFALVGSLLFVALNNKRLGKADFTPPASGVSLSSPPPPLILPAVEPPPEPAASIQPVLMPRVEPAPMAPMPAVNAPDDTLQRLRAPAIIIDLPATQIPRPLPIASGGGDPSGRSGEVPPRALSAADKASSTPADEAGGIPAFENKIQSSNAETSLASQMTHLESTIVQGATIQALLETAINSDLPGFARAIVRRDVLAFDGKSVLIPRGSRVIGQYRNSQVSGESRVFVIWTRLIRPDGVTVQLGSPGGDELGRGGLSGDIDRHFFARFGDAIMLSILNAGVNSVSGTPSTQIAIGSTAAAVGNAASAAMPHKGDIPPTIKVSQGSMVTIFVARDLDFSAVKPVP